MNLNLFHTSWIVTITHTVSKFMICKIWGETQIAVAAPHFFHDEIDVSGS